MKVGNKNANNHENDPIGIVLHHLVDQTEPPAGLEEEIFSSLNSIQMISEIADLFTTKFVNSKAIMMTGISNSDE